MWKPVRAFIAAIGALMLSVSCTVHKVEPPSLTGPSELATSIVITATPDTISQDGASQASIEIYARNASSRPMTGLTLRLACGQRDATGQLIDFGRMSARTLVTGTDGKARAVYTAPPASPVTSSSIKMITIEATTSGSDFGTAQTASATLRLVPLGVILPSARFIPDFTVTPSAPGQGQNVVLDGSLTSDPDGAVVSYSWDFGDGSSGTGKTTSHAFSRVGALSVTLTVADALGRAASATKAVTVGGGAEPTVDFNFSPTTPGINQDIRFVATAQSGVAGHSIVSYAWDMGSGAPKQGSVVTKSYDTAGTYNVTLTVTDDLGLTKTTTKAVTVGASMVADFSVSPSDPNIPVGQSSVTVFFDASPSVSLSAVVAYAWNFGDGGTDTGKTPSHSFKSAGAYVVRLTITDADGHTGTGTKPVTVAAGK